MGKMMKRIGSFRDKPESPVSLQGEILSDKNKKQRE